MQNICHPLQSRDLLNYIFSFLPTLEKNDNEIVECQIYNNVHFITKIKDIKIEILPLYHKQVSKFWYNVCVNQKDYKITNVITFKTEESYYIDENEIFNSNVKFYIDKNDNEYKILGYYLCQHFHCDFIYYLDRDEKFQESDYYVDTDEE